MKHAHLVADAGDGLEEFDRVLDRHVEHVGDRLALELHLQRLAVVALAVADVAGDVDVGQEVHLDLQQAVAGAFLAAAALDVEAEAAGLVAARLAFRQAGEPVADLGEGAGVGRRVGPRRAADRRLVDVDDLVEVGEAVDAVARAADDARAVQNAGGAGVERVDGQRGLARAADAGDAGEGAERELRGHVLEVVGAGALHGDELAGALAAPLRERDFAAAAEVVGGDAGGAGEELFERALATISPPWTPGAGAHVDDMVGVADRVLVMLDDDHGVAEVAQALQRFEQAVVVVLVEADRRFVEDVEDAREAGADLRREADALALAARERARGAVEVEIVEPDIVEEAEPLVDLLEDDVRDLLLDGVELVLEAAEPGVGVRDRAAGGRWRCPRRRS